MTTAPAHTPTQASTYDQLRALRRETATLKSVGDLLGWDQETYMPKGGGHARAEQQGLIAGLVHERRISKRLGELLSQCESDRTLVGDPATAFAANIREMRRDYDLATKLPSTLVAALASTGSQAQDVWKEAREKSDFKLFAPWLEKMIDLTRQKADCYGIPASADGQPGERYDALLNEYEPGVSAREIEAIFTPLRARLAPFIQELMTKGRQPETRVLNAKFDPARQHQFGLFVLKAIHFDLDAGRLDITTHPFCSGVSPGDTRLTTRYRDEKFTDAFFGTLHEAGHGLYEQGLPKLARNGQPAFFGEPLGEDISLGIHESQSRMWENLVGRSRAFWEWALPHAKAMLGGALEQASVDELYHAVNTCKPSFIRVEADEATYNLHVMIRFELERDLFSGRLAVRDVPEAWNAKYKAALGLDVPSDKLGCLQDVHWSFGLLGYFPTYTLGNLYAAQFWETINAQLPDLSGQIRRGEFGALREWLRVNIHQHGRRYRAAELCQRLTSKPLTHEPFMRYLEDKLRPIFGL
jgi:carboxypeptidase Taq